MAPYKLEPGPVSLYFQLHQHLVERIRAGEFGPGDPLPTEKELGDQYGVSRITVRRALDALADERLISRRRGVRTFVVEPPVKSVVLTGSLDDVLSYGSDLSLKLLAKERVEPSPLVAQSLQLPEGARVVRFEVVAASAGEPFAHAEFYLPEAVGALAEEAERREHVPILRDFERKLGRRITRADQTVEPAMADRAMADYLGMKPRSPLLKVVRTYYTESGHPVKADIVHYNPERYRYTVQLFARREI